MKKTRKARLRREALEWLEPRTLLAVLPAAELAGALGNLTGDTSGNMSSPTVVVDRYNPQHLASVWVRNDPDLGDFSTVIQGSYSNDGGATWSPFSPGPGAMIDPAVAPADPTVQYTQTTNPQAAFDNSGRLYVLTQQSNGTNTSGALILRRFDFSGDAPVTSITTIVRQYVQDPVFNPTLTVDDNQESFTDPATGAVQTDPSAGTVWIAWSTNAAPPTGDFASPGLSWNPNAIQVIGSSDHGVTFTAPKYVGGAARYSSADGTFANATPKIAVSQGVAGGPAGGQATVIWDNFGLANVTFDRIQSAAVTGGATAIRANGAGGVINQNPNALPAGVPTTFQVNPNVATGFVLSKLTVSLTIEQADMQNLEAYLTAPDGRRVLLFSNLMNAAGDVSDSATRGIVGANLGIVGMAGDPAAPFGALGTIFDDDAARRVNDRGIALGRAGTFRPEAPQGGSVNLSAFAGMTAGQINAGPWTLTIVAYRDNGTNPPPRVLDWGLNFSGGANVGGTVNVATTNVRGSQSGLYSRLSVAAGLQGIGPGIQIAQDNTLGSFSQNQGRIYVTYVGWTDYSFGAYVNPADNTDIYLVTSDDGGANWTNRGIVNDDAAMVDGFSGANKNAMIGQISGRVQFMPTVAVDQSTGVLVMSWRDGRDDSARARTSVYVASSLDGGASFSEQTYASPAQTTVDAITGRQVVVGPRGDNFSLVNDPIPTLGFGSQMGLAVASGHIYTAWAGNANTGYLDENFVIHGLPFQTLLQRMAIAAGPRIIDGSMGVITNQLAPDGGPVANGFDVTFDRPIDPDLAPRSFTTADVLVYYHDTNNTAGDPSSFIPVNVLNVSPITTSAVDKDGVNLGYTRFRVDFAPSTAVGTYSYIISPEINDQVRSITTAAGLQLGNLMDQNANAIGGQNPLTNPYTGRTPGDAYVAPMPAPLVDVTFGPDPRSLLVPPFSNKSLPLILPGAHLVGTSVPGGTGVDNLVTDGTVDSFLMTFDRDMNAASFTAAKVLQIMGPAGSISGPRAFNSNATGEPIPAPSSPGATSTLLSKLTIPNFGGTLTAKTITLQLNIQFPVDVGLTAVLIGPDGTELELFSKVGGLGSDFTNTIFSDSAGRSINQGSAPFIGEFRPSGAGGLAVFSGKSGADLEGEWTLKITNTRGGTAGALLGWSLNITPVITVTPVSARTFAVNFPRQSLSGTYTIQVASSILDARGQALDSNLNAGLDVLRREAQGVPTTTITQGSGQVNQGLAGGEIRSRINVADNFPIQGTTASGRSGLRLQLSLSTNNVAPLTATLIYHPDDAGAHAVTVFTGLIQGAGSGGFIETVFDDAAGTPISQGSPPYFAGPYAPRMPFLTDPAGPDSGGFKGLLSGGTWELLIESSGGGTATLNSWTLLFEKPLPTSGLGEPVADMTGGGFRIFQMNPTDPLSRNEWTAVGPAPLFLSAGRIGAMAQDPSDPSGNTFYVAGASGGVWKTNNFLTTDPGGPTYIPLTDFGPSNGMNIGGLAVFARNNDPNQSIIIASTGEGDYGTPGVGFLISKDGGATWALHDSARNIDAAGNQLPYDSPARDRTFVGSTSFKVIADPTPTLQGGVLIYAAVAGRNGGLWRSQDTGDTWQLMRPGNATDVVFDPTSNTGGPGGDNALQVIMAAFQGEGIFLSPNRGQVWNQMSGGVGNPLIVDIVNERNVPVGPTGVGPNGLWQRIALAKPALTDNPIQNQVQAGWLYASVTDLLGGLLGVYMTKDYGQNWVRVRIPTEPNVTGDVPAFPTNNILMADFNVLNGQGNLDITMEVDPNNANIVYLGGFRGATGSGMVRIDATNVWDAHNFTFHSSVAGDGAIDLASTGAVTVGSYADGPYGVVLGPFIVKRDYVNYIRSPGNPFDANSTLLVGNIGQFANNGFGATWTPFDAPIPIPFPPPPYPFTPVSYQRLVTMIDPTTGMTRLVYGTNRGVWSVLDDNGTQLYGQSVGSTPTPGQERNGNLQIAQFFYGAAQPSNAAVAASYDQALFYASGNDGAPTSRPNVVTDGDLFRANTGEGYIGGGVAVDQGGAGTRYQTFIPGTIGEPGQGTSFFRVDHIGRTFGLFQQSGTAIPPDPQWTAGPAGANFAVNPVNGNQMIISSNVGRIFATETQGRTWFVVGDPGVFGGPGAYSRALAYGAPDPDAPAGVGNLGNFMYVGTQAGRVFMTRTAGGGNGQNWLEISQGLDGSPIQQIITSPTRSSHAAYAVTTNGVFLLKDSVALSEDPTNAALGWINVTGNLRELPYSIFGQTYTPTEGLGLNQSLSLNTIAVDWRYLIPNSSTDPAGTGLHPILYVGGDSGVFRSLDNGATWTAFPDQSIDGSTAEGGHLPRVSVRDLDLSLGNVNSTTGMPNLAGPYDPVAAVPAPDPNLLLATTYGRGQFAIKMAPLILPGTARISSADTTGVNPDGTVLVNTSRFRVQGLSMATGFGDATRITIFDVTGNAIIGGFNPADPTTNVAANWTDAFGNFNVGVTPGAISANGPRVIQIYATDDAGSIGNVITISIILNADDLGMPVPADPSLAIVPADNTSLAPPAIYTNKPDPRFSGTTSPGATVELLYLDGGGNFVSFSPPVTTTANAFGNFTLTFPASVGAGEGTFTVAAQASNAFGPADHLSAAVTFTIKLTGPTAPPSLSLDPYYDSGIVGDNITDVRMPYFEGSIASGGVTNAGAIIRIYAADANGAPVGQPLAQTHADVNGAFSVQLPQAFSNGVVRLVATAVDAAGNPAPSQSAVLKATIVSVGLNYTGNPIDYYMAHDMTPLPPAPVASPAQGALFYRNSTTGQGLWFFKPAKPLNLPAFWGVNGMAMGSKNDIPLTGDFDGDGKADLAGFNQSTATWTIHQSTQPQTSSTFQFGTPGSSLPIVGNFAGPGATQFGTFTVNAAGIGVWRFSNPYGGGPVEYGFGRAGDVPLVGDFLGLGWDQAAVYRPTSGQFIVFTPASGGQPARVDTVATMAPNLVPVPGKYDNLYYFVNGQSYRTEPAVYNPATGVFTIARPAGSTFPNQVTFQPGDIPVPADYLGVGWDQPGVYRPGTSQFLIKQNQSASTGADQEVAVFPGLLGGPVVPPGAPLSYKIPPLAQKVPGGGGTTPTSAPSAGGTATPPPTSTPPPASTPPPVSAPNSAPAAPSLNYVATNQPGTARPWFAGTAAPGVAVEIFLSGSGVVGSRRVGTVTADANGGYGFQLPAGARNGSYTLVAQVRGANGSLTPIAGTSFNVGPAPRVAPRGPARVAPIARAPIAPPRVSTPTAPIVRTPVAPISRPTLPIRRVAVAGSAAAAAALRRR